MRDFLDVTDLSGDELAAVLDLAERADPPKVLSGKGAGLLFEKPSNRTRNSTEMAVVQLGGHPVTMTGDEVGIDTRETAEDIARTLAGYHALIAARVFEHDKLERMAGATDLPVVNLLSDKSHPCQALADVLTLRQHFGTLDGLQVAWVGDWNNVSRSLGEACVLTGVDFRAACPDGYGPDDRPVLTPEAAVKGADAVVTDVWASMGQEDEAETRRRAFAGFGVDERLMGLAADRGVFLHCLPAHRGEEVAAGVVDGDRSLVWAEAANRMHAIRGLFLFLFGA